MAAATALLLTLGICACVIPSTAASASSGRQYDDGKYHPGLYDNNSGKYPGLHDNHAVNTGKYPGLYDNHAVNTGKYPGLYDNPAYYTGKYLLSNPAYNAGKYLYSNAAVNTGKYDPLFDNPAAAYYNPSATVAPIASAVKYVSGNGQYYHPYNAYNPYKAYVSSAIYNPANNPYKAYVNSAIYNPAYNPYYPHNPKFNPYAPNRYPGHKVIDTTYQPAYPGISFAYQAAYPGTSFAYQAAYPGAHLDPRYPGAHPPTSAVDNAQKAAAGNQAGSATPPAKANTGHKQGY